MCHRRPLFRLSFQTNITIFYLQQKCAKCHSCIRWRDSNPRPSEHEPPPITTRPGLPPKFCLVITSVVIPLDVAPKLWLLAWRCVSGETRRDEKQFGPFQSNVRSDAKSEKEMDSFENQHLINSRIFLNGPIPASFWFFRSFNIPNQMTNIQFEQYKLKKRIWCAWDMNPGRQDGRCRRNHWAMAAPFYYRT